MKRKKRGSGIGIGMSRLVSGGVFDLDAGFGFGLRIYGVRAYSISCSGRSFIRRWDDGDNGLGVLYSMCYYVYGINVQYLALALRSYNVSVTSIDTRGRCSRGV
jgi:hypothetical protein